jgi:hypothetical protein
MAKRENRRRAKLSSAAKFSAGVKGDWPPRKDGSVNVGSTGRAKRGSSRA